MQCASCVQTGIVSVIIGLTVGATKCCKSILFLYTIYTFCKLDCKVHQRVSGLLKLNTNELLGKKKKLHGLVIFTMPLKRIKFHLESHDHFTLFISLERPDKNLKTETDLLSNYLSICVGQSVTDLQNFSSHLNKHFKIKNIKKIIKINI